MRVSIVTPSFRQSNWLKLCIASVADQGVDPEHIIQDAGSDDGTLDWLPHDRRVQAIVEKDTGMYDAINRGLRRATGDLLAWLNCDEQYLPGALASVREFFKTHADVDMLFGDAVFVDEQGNYVGHRKVQVPLFYHTWTCHLSTLSCATFFRRRVVADYGESFNPRLRAGGDAEWMVRLLRRGVSMATLKQFTSVFTLTGHNLGQEAIARQENRKLRESAPLWARLARPILIGHHRLRRLAGGMYSHNPFSFSLYTHAQPERRVLREVARPRFLAGA